MDLRVLSSDDANWMKTDSNNWLCDNGRELSGSVMA